MYAMRDYYQMAHEATTDNAVEIAIKIYSGEFGDGNTPSIRR